MIGCSGTVCCCVACLGGGHCPSLITPFKYFLCQLFTVIFTFVLHDINSVKAIVNIIIVLHLVCLHDHVIFLHITLNMIQIPHTAVNGPTGN